MMKLILSQLTNKQLQDEKVAQLVETKIVERISKILSDQDIVTLDQMIRDENPELEIYIKNKCPNYEEIVEEEINNANQDNF